MHIITDCSRCCTDFMYHQTDTQLFRNVAVQNENGIDEITTTVICQECHEIENISEYIKETANHRGWENAEYMAADKFGEDKVLKAIQYLDKNSIVI